MTNKPKPIFIIGIAGRSGTHFIKQLLRKHPQISNNILKREAHFISEINFLDLYVKNVTYYWQKNQKQHENKIKNLLKINLANGILNFLPKDNDKKYFVINTPYTDNLKYFPYYFKNHKLIIITRNAKDLVESGVRSKFWSYEEGLQLWNRSAKRILNLKKNYSNFIIIKYEDLFTNPQKELIKIFDYLNLKSQNFPFKDIEKTPVQGSSDAKNNNKNWEYKNIEKPKNFKPLSRAENWSFIRNWRFDWKCGKNANKLNYKREKINFKIFYFLLNIFLDAFLWIFNLKIFLKNKIIKYKAQKIK